MQYTWKQGIADIALFIVIIIIVNYTFDLVYKPWVEDYEFKTVYKLSDEYEQPIYFTFNWKTEDELQVGKPVTFWSELRGLPYTNTTESLKEITLNFDERQLNYWSYEGDKINNEILDKDSIIFQPYWEENVFISDKVVVRFILPTNISLKFCDRNQGECIILEDIIHPAPHDLAVQIDTNRIGLGLTLVLAGFSCTIIWARLRPSSINPNKS